MKDERVELWRQLIARVELSRRKGSPKVAPFAADLEIEFTRRMEQLERELAATEQRELISDKAA